MTTDICRDPECPNKHAGVEHIHMHRLISAATRDLLIGDDRLNELPDGQVTGTLEVVSYHLTSAVAGRGGQWEDPVGEARGIIENVIEGWEPSLPADVTRALDRARELLAGVAREQAHGR